MSDTKKYIDEEILSPENVQLYKTLFEIITTQANYVNELRLLTIFFMGALEDKIDNILSKQQYETLFSHMNPLIDMEFLLFVKLTKDWEDDPLMRNIGNNITEHFEEHASSYKCYGDKITTAIDVYECLMKDIKFKEWVQDINNKCTFMNLSNYIKLPASRITQLEFLINTAIREDKNGLISTELEKALHIIGTTATELDFAIGSNERRRTLIRLLQEIELPYSLRIDDFVKQNRVLQSRCLGKIRSSGKKAQFFLFNDLFFITPDIYKTGSMKPIIEDYCERSTLRFKPCDAPQTAKIEFVGTIKGKTSLEVKFDSVEDWREWMMALGQTQSFKYVRESLLSGESHQSGTSMGHILRNTIYRKRSDSHSNVPRIVLTQQEYVENIKFAKVQIMSAVQTLISEYDFQTIFQPLVPIWEKESALLLEMEKAPHSYLLLIKTHYSANIKLYKIYGRAYKLAIQHDLHLLKTNRNYKKIILKIMKLDEAKGTALDYYIMLPLKRVRALITLLKLTDGDDKEIYNETMQTLYNVEQSIKSEADTMKEYEDLIRLSLVFEAPIGIVKYNRKLIFQCEIMKIEEKKKHVCLFFFNDLFIVAERSNSQGVQWKINYYQEESTSKIIPSAESPPKKTVMAIIMRKSLKTIEVKSEENKSYESDHGESLFFCEEPNLPVPDFGELGDKLSPYPFYVILII